MTLTLRSTLQRTTLILTIAMAGLIVATQAVPAAHAAPPPAPTITTSVTYSGFPGGANLNVQGVNFTPAGSVKVEVFDRFLHLAASRTFTASVQFSCHAGIPPVCTATGTFGQGFRFSPLPPPQVYHVIAFDFGTGRWSNWSSQPII